MTELRIIGLLITDRIKEAGLTQQVLTEHAHVIKSRLGFHEVDDNICSSGAECHGAVVTW